MAKIKSIIAREILASGGAPTLEATVILESGAVGEASISYGASTGSKEAKVILDEDKNRYNGKGMLGAIKKVKEEIEPLISGMEIENLREIDEKMIKYDDSADKSSLGGNAMLAVSMASARAMANERKLELYEYLREGYGLEKTTKLPKPMVVMIEGGKHADKTTDLQEYLVSAMGEKTVAENIRMEMEIYEALKKILKREGLSTNVGNEGAFAPNGIVSNEKPMEYIVEAIGNAGYLAGVDAGISIDAAASEFSKTEIEPRSTIYDLGIEQKKLTAEELIEYYASWIDKYPFVSWEDMLSEFDWESWPKLLARIGGKFPLIADDLTVTNSSLWKQAMEMKAADAILIKLNQAGTVTETIDCCQLARENNFWTVTSHRGGGESNDTFMVDVAVAVGSEYLKCGPTRGERVAKYNRLMRIEEDLGAK